MPNNFLEGCPAVETFCEDIAGLKPGDIDAAATKAGLSEEYDQFTAEDIQQATGIDSLEAIEGAEKAEACDVCKFGRVCILGEFLKKVP